MKQPQNPLKSPTQSPMPHPTRTAQVSDYAKITQVPNWKTTAISVQLFWSPITILQLLNWSCTKKIHIWESHCIYTLSDLQMDWPQLCPSQSQHSSKISTKFSTTIGCENLTCHMLCHKPVTIHQGQKTFNSKLNSRMPETTEFIQLSWIIFKLMNYQSVNLSSCTKITESSLGIQ